MTKKLRKEDRRKEQKPINFRDRRRFDRRMKIEEFKKLLFASHIERSSQKSRIVITGIGVVAPNGIGKDQFWDGLAKGTSGLRPISMFEVNKYSSKQGGEIIDFEAARYLGKKGLRALDRSTRLTAVAARLALDDSGLKITGTSTYDTGIVVGTSMGSVCSISEFDKSGLIEGPSFVNPALFPNTVINAPASYASIMFDIRGLNATISTGFCSALDAAVYAYHSIALNKVSTILTGAVEEFCHQTFLGFYKAGCLAGSNPLLKGIEQSMPFDRRRNGLVLGEGSGVLVFEDLDHARERKATIYGEVLGFDRAFDPDTGAGEYNLRASGPIRAMRLALENAHLASEDIDLVCANANSSLIGDRMETYAIKEVFGERAAHLPITAIKSMLGEGYSVSGSFQIMAALLAINKGVIPPTINYHEKDPDCDLDYVPDQARKSEVKKVMINSFSPHGHNISFIVGQYCWPSLNKDLQENNCTCTVR